MLDRLKGLLLVVAAIVAIAGTATPAAARKQKAAATPAPTPGPLAYYLMSGNVIVSPPYVNLVDCNKDLNQAKHNMVPLSDTLVCAYRRP